MQRLDRNYGSEQLHRTDLGFLTPDENCLGASSRMNMTPRIISVGGSCGLEDGTEPSVKITTSAFWGPERGHGRRGPCIPSDRHL